MMFLGVIFVLTSPLMAQDDSYNTYERRAQLANDTMKVDVMVIPANPKLYNSFFDKQMCEANELNVVQLRDTILSELSYYVAKAINDSVKTGIIPESMTGYREDMDFVYDALSYKYDLLPQPKVEETTLDKWKTKFKKTSNPPAKTGTRMEGGQIVTNEDKTPRYTNAQVENPSFLTILNMRYQPKTFVLINQLEIVIGQNTSQIDLHSDNYPREVRVHYTVVDADGKELQSGLVVRNASSYDNSLNSLFTQSFQSIGQEIASRMTNI